MQGRAQPSRLDLNLLATITTLIEEGSVSGAALKLADRLDPEASRC